MIDISERDLKEVSKDFKNKDILIELNDGIEGNIFVKSGSIIYEEENGYINIIGQNHKLRINVTLLYRLQVSENRTIFGAKIDSQVDLKIKLLDRIKF